MKKRKLKPNFKYALLFMLTTALLIASSLPNNEKRIIESSINRGITASLIDTVPTYTVCLDAGHGGEDVGANIDGRTEKDDCLNLTLRIGKYLEENSNIKVVYTRKDDTFIEIDDRPIIANENNADVLLSIHRNYYDGYQEVNGFEAWIDGSEKQEETLFAQSLLNAIEETTPSSVIREIQSGTSDGYGEYSINHLSTMPSCILEMGFISSNIDNQLLDENLDQYAQAISKAIVNYLVSNT